MSAKPLALLLAVVLIALGRRTHAETVYLGALLDDQDLLHRSVFQYALDHFGQVYRTKTFSPVIANLHKLDALQVYKQACALLPKSVVAIFGPSDGAAAEAVRSLCDAKELPHFMTGVDRPGGRPQRGVSFSLYPTPESIGRAFAAIIRHYDWRSFVLLYEHGFGLVELQDLLAYSTYPRGPSVRIRKLSDSGDYRPLLKEIRNEMGEYRVVVHCRLETARLFLEQAASLSMVATYYHYAFTNLVCTGVSAELLCTKGHFYDVHTLDLDGYRSSGCNVTGLRFVDLQSAKTKSFLNGFRGFLQEQGSVDVVLPPVGVQTSAAVLFDSVGVLTQALVQVGELKAESLNCSSSTTWQRGSTAINYISVTEYNGTTGVVRFGSDGARVGYAFTAVELSKDGFREFGRWNESHSLTVTRDYTAGISEVIETLENRTLRVTVRLEEPFVMMKAEEATLHGNDRYEGYCVDLLMEIAKYRKFNFTIHEVKDGSYGSKENGEWNGMVGELMRGEADLALASLTISYSRSEVIDFTVPFMHLGISILFKKPEKKDPSLFTFLSPLSLDVWIYMLAAYVGVSLMLWILARFSPYEWYNPHPCNPDTDVVENQFNLLNSLWFTVGSLMQQGSDLTPRAASTRIVAGIWWFFTLILISSYTANLAAFLTVERMVSPIESADDLAKQTKIKYGSLNRGSTMTFFKESKIQTYERMWAFMESAHPPVFVNSSLEGIERVKRGDYAYLMESAMLEYYVERQCDLMQIGGLLDSKGYGIGLPKGSQYREPISTAILMLQEKTVLTELKDKWWKQKRGGGQCKGDDANKGRHNELGLQNVGGVFVLLLGGLSIAFAIAIVEFVHKSRRNADIDKRPLLKEMWQELKFAMRCSGSRRPARRRSLQADRFGGSAAGDSQFASPYRKPPDQHPFSTNFSFYNESDPTVMTRSN